MATAKQPITEDLFREVYGYEEEEKTPLKTIVKRTLRCTKSRVYTFLPFAGWIQQYNLKENLLKDVIAGFMVAIMHIPHGLAYAPLGKVEPAVGFYMAVFPVIVYILLGTSRHISLGTFAVVCAMVGEVVQTHTLPTLYIYSDMKSNRTSDARILHTNLEVGVTLCFMVGLWQLGLGLLQLGYLNFIMSESLVSGYTAGAALHVTSYQLKNLFGCNITSHTGPFKLYWIYHSFFTHLDTINFITMSISITSIIILGVNEYLKIYQKKRCSKFQYNFPMELMVIILGTMLSYFLKFNENYGVSVVGEIPTGFPSVMVPSWAIFFELLQESLVVTVVTLSVNISLARMFAKKGSYRISSTQEFIAYGVANMISSFFQCLPSAASLSRSAMQYKVGGKSQLASVVSVILIVLNLLFAAPLFSPVPYCVLSSIVVVTLRGLLMQFLNFPRIWRESTWDGLVWLGTYLTVIVLGLDLGLMTGIVLSVMCVVFKAHAFRVSIQGRVPETSIYLPIIRYSKSQEIPEPLILKLFGTLNYTNGIHLEQAVAEAVEKWKVDHPKPANVVMDMSAVTDVDPTAVNSIRDIFINLKTQDINLYLTDCNIPVYKRMGICGLFNDIPKDHILATVSDAVDYLTPEALKPVETVKPTPPPRSQKG